MTGVNTALLACSPPAFSKLLPASVKPVPGYITQQPAELLRDRTTGFRSTSPAVSTQLVNTTPGQSPWRALSPGLTEVAQKFLVLYHLPSKLENNWVLVKEMEPMLKNNVMLQKSKIEIGKSREKYSLFVSSLLWLNDHSVSAMYYCSLKHGLPCSHKIGCQGSTREQLTEMTALWPSVTSELERHRLTRIYIQILAQCRLSLETAKHLIFIHLQCAQKFLFGQRWFSTRLHISVI